MKNDLTVLSFEKTPDNSEFERFGYKATGKDKLFLSLSVIIMFMIAVVSGL